MRQHNPRSARHAFAPGGPAVPGFPGGPGYGQFRGGGRGRRRRGQIRSALLRLLSEEPRNGYQLMQAIEELSDGRWRPSPGSIYPTLSQLEDEGLIRSAQSEGNKVFELTDEGRQHLEEHHSAAPPWDSGDEPTSFAELRTQMRQLHVAARQVADAGQEEQLARAAEALEEARRTLYRILAGDDRG